ncbi:hypothetical protein RRG08_021220 [Elysia crispata]|uniref:Uncharacterized protein n=1 Tax=Elysia crispata TaxID=231223 RepID=A0AAE1D6M8_9GAST|nr:hypothetical protein RRG08_021220 [Elysia crispata]
MSPEDLIKSPSRLRMAKILKDLWVMLEELEITRINPRWSVDQLQMTSGSTPDDSGSTPDQFSVESEKGRCDSLGTWLAILDQDFVPLPTSPHSLSSPKHR